MIKLLKKDMNNGVDNGADASCVKCIWYACVDYSCGCSHPILYDDNGEIIEEINDAIIECMSEPRYCCLMEKKQG